MGDGATLQRRGRWAAIALAAMIVMDLITVWSNWVTIRLLDRAIDGEDIALSTFDDDDGRQALVAILQILVFVIAAVLFLRWFHRAYAALPHLGAARRFGTRWAVGSWFVPVLSLWRPKQIANDLWRGTEPPPGASPPSTLGAGWSRLLMVWWAGLLVVAFLETWALIAYVDAPFAVDEGPLAAVGITGGLEDVRSVARLDLIAAAVGIPVALLAIVVVRALTARHVLRERDAGEAHSAIAPSAGDTNGDDIGDPATLARRGQWAVIALGAVIVTDVVGIWSDTLQMSLLQRAIDGEDIALSTFEADDNRQIAVVLVQFLALAAAIVLFLRWFHRAYVALPHLGATRRFGTGWAIGGWFVPILALWRPKQIANDLWRGTEPPPGATRPSTLGASWSWLLNLWWAGFIILGVLEQRAGIVIFSAPYAADAGPLAVAGATADAEEAQSAARLDLIASVVDIPVGVLAILVVRALTARHVARPRLAVESAPPALPVADPAT